MDQASLRTSGSFCIPRASFPRKRESRDRLLTELDARLRGHDRQGSPTAQLVQAQVPALYLRSQFHVFVLDNGA